MILKRPRMAFMNNMSLLDPAIIIDIDESNASPEQFHSKFGWSSRGKKAIRLHFQVGSKHYSIAAYAMFGFIAWEIFEGTVTQKEFQHFITVTLAPLITGDSVGLYDNASIHKTVESFGVLDRTFPEGFLFCPAYSCDLNPLRWASTTSKRGRIIMKMI